MVVEYKSLSKFLFYFFLVFMDVMWRMVMSVWVLATISRDMIVPFSMQILLPIGVTFFYIRPLIDLMESLTGDEE